MVGICRQQFLEDEKNMNKDELLLVYADIYCRRPANCTLTFMTKAYFNHCISPINNGAYGVDKLKIVLRYIVDRGIPFEPEYTGIHKTLKAWGINNVLY